MHNKFLSKPITHFDLKGRLVQENKLFGLINNWLSQQKPRSMGDFIHKEALNPTDCAGWGRLYAFATPPTDV